MSDNAALLCEFIFILNNFSPVESYFENCLEIRNNFICHNHLRILLDLPASDCRKAHDELKNCGFLDPDNHYLRLDYKMQRFWEATEKKEILNNLFFRPLTGETLPLEDFAVPAEAAAYAKALLQKKGTQPVHILLYGPPGTGKSTFARSLAEACGVKAWLVSSGGDDNEKDRMASLIAGLHAASRQEGSFVVLDEAETMLDTDIKGRGKAWLNAFLETPGRRVIWITNEIYHIDQAVRRRFNYSIHFEELGRRELKGLWRQVLARNRVSTRLPENALERFSKTYTAQAAVIENAVRQAKEISSGQKDFAANLECALRAYAVLRRNGAQERIRPEAPSLYTPEGVCFEGSVEELLQTCRKADAVLRRGDSLPPGSAAMLFYGPPGTGKTALARYIAQETDRECMVKRASDLLSPWVGESEQNVAEAFQRAEKEGAVLVIDEADSFIYSRDAANRSWERTLVNEFLTALEECRSFCICTTNMREGLDAAAMRRFSFKYPFTYARPEQVAALYAKLLSPLCGEALPEGRKQELSGLTRLTPGDFHAVRSQFVCAFNEKLPDIGHDRLLAALRKEQGLKLKEGAVRIGFGA